MSLFSVFKAAQMGNEDAVLVLYNMFLPKIKKCGRSLHYETSVTDITIKFLEFIKNTDIDRMSSKNDGAIVNYIDKFFTNTCINLSKAQKDSPQIIYLDDENTFINDIPYYDDELSNLEYDYFQYLTNLQKKIIILKYIYGFSDQEIAISLGISRQAVNRAKNRGISIIKEICEKS
ncbi:sigma-70 family RNA polymerase sigma factor [Sedimentibacter hydroxybenzoicus DSM 7310]|uniref:Sigma-70 family RNA polymerase sigma factor n=1 Tax=Sedimentibacter hydroxybenzoicus DSM 7310 TaxID=1123245 RepID=A0A974BKS7_SEDHY|nr:sigma-70 family RNA polymerase sigma factor [Sedimentibacter hydroxybenzoicus]NYB75149.1 sigma-70 family RNA polymerase sigma factor [Sedimentibacter hydroxybenzoicus DSM 7310]